eukprot:TRINITY_DN735_c0_g1_i3.p2 TRINITY_DN735_c0_g1~~TRINITY_DN735_c0_g1_i3.p2  ORF type:complete len:127 (+),score=39.59 TRINITY_DN735_c0_g1_i3:44-424(+)
MKSLSLIALTFACAECTNLRGSNQVSNRGYDILGKKCPKGQCRSTATGWCVDCDTGAVPTPKAEEEQVANRGYDVLGKKCPKGQCRSTATGWCVDCDTGAVPTPKAEEEQVANRDYERQVDEIPQE